MCTQTHTLTLHSHTHIHTNYWYHCTAGSESKSVFASFERSKSTSQKPNMHVIGKRSRSCCTMRESISSNTAKKAPCTSVKHGDTFCEFVCPQKKNNQMVLWSAKRLGWNQLYVKKNKSLFKPLWTKRIKNEGGRRVTSQLTTQFTAFSFKKRYGWVDCSIKHITAIFTKLLSP